MINYHYKIIEMRIVFQMQQRYEDMSFFNRICWNIITFLFLSIWKSFSLPFKKLLMLFKRYFIRVLSKQVSFVSRKLDSLRFPWKCKWHKLFWDKFCFVHILHSGHCSDKAKFSIYCPSIEILCYQIIRFVRLV